MMQWWLASVTSQAFLRKYNLGASTVQGVIKTLLDRDFITSEQGFYQLSDRFFAQYLTL